MTTQTKQTNLRDLSDDEARVLVRLARMLARMDGAVSDEERSALADLASECGDERFWQFMEEISQRVETQTQILDGANQINSADARELIYGALYRLSIADGVDTGESDLLDHLAARWDLSVKSVESD